MTDVLSEITKDANLYGEKMVQIPAPRFIIFYNGIKKRPEREVLKLSDLYGGLLLQNRHPVLKTFLEKEKLIYTGIKENLEKQPASEKIRTRLAEVEDILHYNELALQFYV